jgi:PAS domain S-box-containing protein
MESPSIVICDEKDSASHLESLLHNLGYKKVAIASDRKELQILLKSGSADLLIIDADCGEKEKCLTLSHTFCQTNDIPIIYVIPHTGQWLEQNAAMLDTYGHLFKPVRQRELHLTIEGTLSRYKSKKDLERQLQELSLIHDISQAAASIRDIDELLKYITQRIGQLMRASAIYVALDEPESSQVNIRYWSSPIPNLSLQQIPHDPSLIGDVIRNRRTMLINENFGDNLNRLRGVFLKDGVVQIPKAWLGIPIMFLHQSLGAICVQDFVQEQAFSGEQVSLLETIAASVAVALKNAQLFTSFQEELAQRAARELELQENKQKLETLFSLLPVGVSVLDERKNILFANPALAGILGVSEQELNGQTCARNRYFSPDGLPLKQEEYACEQAFREKRAIYNVEAGIKTHEDGHFTWLNISALPMDLYDWRAMVVTSDITQRKNNENEIRRREAELLESHQIAHMGRWEIDRETFEMRWSEGIYNLLELDPRTVKPSYETFISFFSTVHLN